MIFFKSFLSVFFLLFFLNVKTYAVSDLNIKVAETVIDIKYLSQKIAKNYLFLYHLPSKKTLKRELNADIKLLEEHFRFVAKSTQDADTKDILNFLSYTKDQIKDLLENDITLEGCSSILDYSESIYEGAESALSTMPQRININETKVYIMRVLKTYMAVNNFKKSKIVDKDQLVSEISSAELKSPNLNMDASWKAFKKIQKPENGYIPNVVSLLIRDIEKRAR